MTREQLLSDFVAWWREFCKGDEKGEAQIFLDRLFTALGYEGGLKAAAGDPERRIRFTLEDRPTTRFADLVISGRVLIEMKKRGEKLAAHQLQALDYWKYLTPHPRYIVLCNFDEFWVYDMERQVDAPLAKLPVERLPDEWGPLAFLFPQPETPVFQREFDLVELTQDAARSLSEVFRRLIGGERDLEREQAQRFILQCMLALFAEDIGLLPRYTFTRVIEDCQAGSSSYDLFQLLFSAMNRRGIERAGRFFGVDYFDGGLFAVIDPIELNADELRLLREAADRDWSKIRPAIFGTIFESSMAADERHQVGAHFTSERDILRIVEPVITRPWRERIEAASGAEELRALHAELCAYRVLDPACGSGNFLYVAYREMKRLERRLLDRWQAFDPTLYLGPIIQEKPVPARKGRLTDRATYVGPANPWALPERPVFPDMPHVSTAQFFGLDVKPFAVELAKVTLMIAKKLAIDELDLPEHALPLDNLDANIRCADALFAEWPAFDACIGNPPYMGAKRLKQEHDAAYINRVRAAFPNVPGNADYCVYWFNKAQRVMQPGARAGLVGTNTIRQNYSREGGLDVIVREGGQIYEAVSSMPWSGEAAVHVSIVCWSKGEAPSSPARLWIDDGERCVEQPTINSALSTRTDVSGAKALACNTEPKRVFQGLIPGHEAFILTPDQALNMIKRDPSSSSVIVPYLIGRDLLANPGAKPTRFVIDLNEYDALEIQRFRAAYVYVREHILPVREDKARAERELNQRLLAEDPKAVINTNHQQYLSVWWKHTAHRIEMTRELRKLRRYVVCSRVTKRPVFEFADEIIRPSDMVQVFAFEDDYSFGILQSNMHWQWFQEKASTLRSDFRYTPSSVFDTFPWPQSPSAAQVRAVAEAGRALHEFRRERMARSERLTLRDLYRSLEAPGKNPLRDLHAALDAAVLAAYGFEASGDVLAQLLALNQAVAARLERGEAVTAPGIPPDYPHPAELVSAGCIQPPELL